MLTLTCHQIVLLDMIFSSYFFRFWPACNCKTIKKQYTQLKFAILYLNKFHKTFSPNNKIYANWCMEKSPTPESPTGEIPYTFSAQGLKPDEKAL